jgi:hypothetical protein
LSFLFLSTKEEQKYLFLEYHNLNPLSGQDIHCLLLANIYFKIRVEQRADMNARCEQVDKRFGQTADIPSTL